MDSLDQKQPYSPPPGGADHRFMSESNPIRVALASSESSRVTTPDGADVEEAEVASDLLSESSVDLSIDSGDYTNARYNLYALSVRQNLLPFSLEHVPESV